MNATELKNQAALAKRTSTALLQFSKKLALNKVDQEVLQRAAKILSSVGSKVKSEAATAKRKEVAQEKAIAAATVEAKKLIATWPSETKLDKTSIICTGYFGEASLLRYLEEKDGKELDWYINAVFDTSTRDIVASVAYRSVVDGKSVAVIAEYERQRLERTRGKSSVLIMAKQWQEKSQTI